MAGSTLLKKEERHTQGEEMRRSGGEGGSNVLRWLACFLCLRVVRSTIATPNLPRWFRLGRTSRFEFGVNSYEMILKSILSMGIGAAAGFGYHLLMKGVGSQ